jgi:hypothetical protein
MEGTLTEQPGGRKMVRQPAGVPYWKQQAARRTAPGRPLGLAVLVHGAMATPVQTWQLLKAL